MAEEPAAEIQLLRSQKAKLIEILSGDADFILQHADSRCLLSLHGYQQVKACRIPSEKVTELLDHIIQRGPEAAQGLLELLKDQALRETFPMLRFIEDQQVNTASSGNKERKRKGVPDLQATVSSKQICKNGSRLVTEKQLMTVARVIGRSWREIGRLALDIPSVKLEQIEEDHSLHVERVFAMLRSWCTCQRGKATAAHLHSLLSKGDWALPPESIDFLLETV
uniref:uncharacterized protein zgc:174906 n=1 Tax=Scatophagus argus TaxID=75038 RepID=UPI001ED84B28|nr:uncharacterized protein zgc:174906 [Scatophagus argus]XP_046252475.1 uncharacterized protein zgc:174906 [Scatophagus argus]XP_046252476.1 uncharacterized protein zgc:174906 [Scatophagus argus]